MKSNFINCATRDDRRVLENHLLQQSRRNGSYLVRGSTGLAALTVAESWQNISVGQNEGGLDYALDMGANYGLALALIVGVVVFNKWRLNRE